LTNPSWQRERYQLWSERLPLSRRMHGIRFYPEQA
jgi:hypothetical protein